MLMDHQCVFMDSFDEEMVSASGQDYQNNILISSSNSINILSSNLITSFNNFPCMPPPKKQHKPNTNEASSFTNSGPSENPNSMNPPEESYNINSENFKRNSQQNKKKSRTRPPSQAYDHIVAERRRREQLSRLFIALSAIVPGLKKTDKTSVLGGAVKYLKHLQERVETLEKLSAKKSTMESSVVVLKKSKIVVEDEGSSDEKSGSSDEQMAPEIVARVMNNNILLKVLCGKQKGILANLLAKVESLNMVVANTNVTPFGSSALDITITAEMEKDFSLTVKEVVSALRASLQSES
ncbi:hypothetical protein BUALT_Bualt04G0094000 [Buddleja alternifolia]|uniref:BHLH domain-containing protein n=1 Tax=Buddleja alternifolia TaxID=168488 RepID=A0AAV6XU13_9LAMI|nr:hypothetical protein BUALT_Bualt04G0094000 [Buddleja alternifolia]